MLACIPAGQSVARGALLACKRHVPLQAALHSWLGAAAGKPTFIGQQLFQIWLCGSIVGLLCKVQKVQQPLYKVFLDLDSIAKHA